MKKHKFYSLLLVILGIVGLVFTLINNVVFIIVGSFLVLFCLIFSALIFYTTPNLSGNQPKASKIQNSDRVAELEGLYQTLQKNYVQKTSDLQSKIDDLERFHRLSIGRELRVVELKKEVEKLKKEQIELDDSKVEPKI